MKQHVRMMALAAVMYGLMGSNHYPAPTVITKQAPFNGMGGGRRGSLGKCYRKYAIPQSTIRARRRATNHSRKQNRK